MLCLVVASGLLIWGQTVFAPYLKGIAFILYWLICLLFALGAIVIALFDICVLRRRTREERRALVQKALIEVEGESRDASQVAENTANSKQPKPR